MSRIIAIANHKGGVGKTTTTANVGACLSLQGYRVLLIDLDAQANLTDYYLSKRPERTVYNALTEESPLPITEIGERLSIVPSSLEMLDIENKIADNIDRAELLQILIEPIKDKYDYILLDCPPSLGMLTVNAMAASDGVVIPMQCEFYALEGLSQLMITVGRIKNHYNSALTVTGILITMYNQRLLLSQQVMSELRRHYADKLLTPPISRSVKVSEAPGFGMPVYYHDKRNKGATEYLECAKDLASRI